MLEQSYSTKCLMRLILLKDFKRYDLGQNKEEISNKIVSISNKINDNNYQVSEFEEKIINNKKIFSPVFVKDEFAIRKLYDNLKKLYKFK
jgi:hypothetical protein